MKKNSFHVLEGATRTAYASSGSHPACCAKMSLDRIDPDKMSHGTERMGDMDPPYTPRIHSSDLVDLCPTDCLGTLVDLEIVS